MPYAQPNSLPQAYLSWQEWRMSYESHVRTFINSAKGDSDELYLRIKLKRLGYVGALLNAEIEHIKSL